jgi:hypothetical protein
MVFPFCISLVVREHARANTVTISSQTKAGHPSSRSTSGAVEPLRPCLVARGRLHTMRGVPCFAQMIPINPLHPHRRPPEAAATTTNRHHRSSVLIQLSTPVICLSRLQLTTSEHLYVLVPISSIVYIMP